MVHVVWVERCTRVMDLGTYRNNLTRFLRCVFLRKAGMALLVHRNCPFMQDRDSSCGNKVSETLAHDGWPIAAALDMTGLRVVGRLKTIVFRIGNGLASYCQPHPLLTFWEGDLCIQPWKAEMGIIALWSA